MALHIRSKTTDALVRKLAVQRGVGVTKAVHFAVEAALEKRDEAIQERLKRMRVISDRIASRPRTGLTVDKAFFDEMSGD